MEHLRSRSSRRPKPTRLHILFFVFCFVFCTLISHVIPGSTRFPARRRQIDDSPRQILQRANPQGKHTTSYGLTMAVLMCLLTGKMQQSCQYYTRPLQKRSVALPVMYGLPFNRLCHNFEAQCGHLRPHFMTSGHPSDNDMSIFALRVGFSTPLHSARQQNSSKMKDV